MIRFAIEDLLTWKKSKWRKPLIVRGARQVGKTWLIQFFGRQQYEKVAYINFEGNSRMQRLFEVDFDTERLIAGIEIEVGFKIDYDKTLLIFDEIQEVPRALSSLKYFCENAPQYHIIAAGSLLGIALHTGTSFPVGKVDFLELRPLCFNEFLLALQEDELVALLKRKDWKLIAVFKDRFIKRLKQYFFVGGMPEVVVVFTQKTDMTEVRSIQQKILFAYDNDFSKHVPAHIMTRLREVWNSIPAQMSKENRKFIYGLVRQGARAREYETALAWLCDYGLVAKVFRIDKPGIPLKTYEDRNAFKLFLLDVGLLAALAGLQARTLLDGNGFFQEFKGAITEQFVFEELSGKKDIQIYYWSAEKGSAEIDFVIQVQGLVMPCEVKAAENLQAKSLKSFQARYQPKVSLRTSMADYRNEGWLINIPLYALGAEEFFDGQSIIG